MNILSSCSLSDITRFFSSLVSTKPICHASTNFVEKINENIFVTIVLELPFIQNKIVRTCT